VSDGEEVSIYYRSGLWKIKPFFSCLGHHFPLYSMAGRMERLPLSVGLLYRGNSLLLPVAHHVSFIY